MCEEIVFEKKTHFRKKKKSTNRNELGKSFTDYFVISRVFKERLLDVNCFEGKQKKVCLVYVWCQIKIKKMRYMQRRDNMREAKEAIKLGTLSKKIYHSLYQDKIVDE